MGGYWRRRVRLFLTGELSKDLGDHIRFFSPGSLARVAGLADLEAIAACPYAWNKSAVPRLALALAWGLRGLARAS